MTPVDEDWRRVGRAIEQRIADRLLSKSEVIQASGVSDKTLNGYIAGEPIKRIDKKRDLAKALGWTPDSIDRIYRGEDPIEVAGQPNVDIVGRVSRLEDRAERIERLLDRMLLERGEEP